MTDAGRRQHGTAAAWVLVACFSAAAAVLLLLSIPLPWAILATLGLALAAVRLARDIRGNRAM